MDSQHQYSIPLTGYISSSFMIGRFREFFLGVRSPVLLAIQYAKNKLLIFHTPVHNSMNTTFDDPQNSIFASG